MSAAAPEPRERVGPYQLIRAIGAGGSARIDLARIDRAYNFQRHVVVKRPLEHLRGSPQVAQSLRREARLGGRLRHPNLVAVLDAGEHGGYDYLVLEYVHGASLRTLMQTDQPGRVREIPLAVALGIAIDIARGLHEAHELTDEKGSPLGLVHRDVTPGNVLLGLDGSVKVAYFGIAKETRVATLSGSMHGTVTYMAPEQCRGHAFDRRADVFSLGVIVYELLAHARLFWADNDVASLHRVLSGDVVPPRQLEPALSPALEQVVMTAIAGDPNKRFATARAFADSLEGLAATEGHILGARLVARTLEEAVGPKYAPWIGSTTVVDPPRKPEASLVAVIEASAPDIEPIFSTFGPADRRDAEEGEVPSAPSVAVVGAVRFPPKRRTGLVVGALAACIAAGVVVAFLLSSHKPAPPPSTVHVMAPPSRAPVLAPAVDPVPVPVAVPDPVPVAGPGPVPGPVHHHHHAATPPPPAGSASETGSATPPAPQPAPTPTPKPGDVEWNPTLFFPGSGSGSSK